MPYIVLLAVNDHSFNKVNLSKNQLVSCTYSADKFKGHYCCELKKFLHIKMNFQMSTVQLHYLVNKLDPMTRRDLLKIGK